MEKLRRPWRGASNQELMDYYREVASALDDAGVLAGEEFVIAKVEKNPKIEQPGDNALGGFQGHSETSRKAALANYPKSGSQRRRILNFLIAQGGRTREELAERLDLPDSSVRPRIVELVEGDWVEETKITRRTKAGQQAAVVIATRKAMEHARTEP